VPQPLKLRNAPRYNEWHANHFQQPMAVGRVSVPARGGHFGLKHDPRCESAKDYPKALASGDVAAGLESAVRREIAGKGERAAPSRFYFLRARFLDLAVSSSTPASTSRLLSCWLSPAERSLY